MKARKSTSALCAFFVLAALIVAGCGSSSSSSSSKAGSVPAGDVAVVAGNPISKRALLHWMYVDAKGQSAQTPGTPVIVPEDPPNFTKCIAQARASVPQLAKATDKQIRTECQSLFTSLSGTVLDFLIKGYWYQGSAHKLGLKLTDAELAQAITKAKTASGIKTAAEFAKFLASSGYTAEDIAFRIRVTTLYGKLVKRHPTTVTAAEIASYYAAHKSSYGSAEKLNLRVVLAKTQAEANAAKAALRSGQSWDAVAKKYSIDPTTKNTGGLLTGITANEEDAAESKAAFAAPLHKLVGPVKGQFGYYVLEVLKKIPSTQETSAQATAAIRQTLTQQKQTAAAQAVDSMVTSQWKSRTVCTPLFANSDCSNYVKPASASATTPAPGATAPATTPAPNATAPATTPAPSAKSSTTSSSSSK